VAAWPGDRGRATRGAAGRVELSDRRRPPRKGVALGVPAGALHPGRSGRTDPRRVVARWVRQGIWRPFELACRRSPLVPLRVTVSEPEESSSATCDAWVLHIPSDDGDDPPFSRTGAATTSGAGFLAAMSGPQLGLLQSRARPGVPDAALGQGP
jgi:hypothetical protein